MGGVKKYFFHFQILFLTPFCNPKRYFCVFDHFIHKSLPKNLKAKKNMKNYEVFDKITKSFNIQLGVKKYFFHFQILFLTSFCNLKLYFLYFFFDHFIHKSLPKKLKLQKY